MVQKNFWTKWKVKYMTYPKLIILYGKISDGFNQKQQNMIDGLSTCGYRPYAEKFGDIIYLSKQNVLKSWEHCFTPKQALEFINNNPGAIVWSVKHDPNKDQQIIKHIDFSKNRVYYYSCCANNTINEWCNVSLVDTEYRLMANAQLWVKGKDPNYWKPIHTTKIYDYLLIGRRGDKNEAYFIYKLTKDVKEKRYILWIGGKEHESKINKSHHEVVVTEFLPMDKVRDTISLAKIGILLTDLKTEGFPQSLLEMTMCGVPVLYNSNAPRNHRYHDISNIYVAPITDSIKHAEIFLKDWSLDLSIKCRAFAKGHYSLEKSYESILRGF